MVVITEDKAKAAITQEAVAKQVRKGVYGRGIYSTPYSSDSPFTKMIKMWRIFLYRGGIAMSTLCRRRRRQRRQRSLKRSRMMLRRIWTRPCRPWKWLCSA